MSMRSKLEKELKDDLPPEVKEKLPSSYSVIGDVLVIRFSHDIPKKYKKLIAETLLKLEKKAKTVIEQEDTISLYRNPVVKFYAGRKKTQTIHKEFNTRFTLDVAKITFSPGNKNERERLINIVNDNEIIVDMFACVGNLSLAIAKNHENVKVYAIEKNKVAFNYLRKNVELNNLAHCYFPIFGDNRKKTPKNIANRVLMGFFDVDKKQLETAIDAIDRKGWIHLHNLVRRTTEKDEKLVLFEQLQKEKCFTIGEINKRVVKKFSPTKIHLCYDIFIKKENRLG